MARSSNELINKIGIERMVLSIIMKDKDKILECCSDNLFAEHFSNKVNQTLYSVCVYLSQQENINRLDSMLIYNTIQDPQCKEDIDRMGGMEYIDALFASSVSDNLSYCIKQLKETSVLRQIYDFAEDVQGEVLRQEDNLEELITGIQERILNISIQNGEDVEVNRLGSTTEERLRRRLENPSDILGYALGWQVWDKVTQGLQSNDLTVICGESKTGKSTLLLNMSKILSIDIGIPGLYIDTEMTTDEQEDRLLAILSLVPFEEIRNGKYAQDTEYGRKEDKIIAVDRAVNKLKTSKLHHVYMPSFTIDKVSALVRKYKIQENIGYFIFDYIKLPDSEVKNLQNAQEWQRLGYFTSCLKNLCGVCNIPCVTAAQANRSSIGNTNQDANSLGGSYRILQLATRLCFIRNKLDTELIAENNSRGNQVLKIAYQRHGSSTGVEIDMQFNRPILQMLEVGRRS